MKSFFAGIGIGFGVGLLLAPAAGSETRKRVIETVSDQAQVSIGPIVNAVRESVGNFIDAAKEPDQQNTIGAALADEASRILMILNSGSKTRLMKVSGIGDATARRIIDGRPYQSANQLVENGIVSEAIMTELKKTLLDDDEAA